MLALQRAGITVDTYDSYEIDKNTIKVSQANFPNIIQHGSVIGADFTQYKGYDLLIGGSPCQGFSFAGKQLNFNDPRSALFFEFVRALKEAEPKYFLLENVRMKKEYEAVITKMLGVEPICINSNLVSAQNRVRLYWTNIPNVKQPEDKKVNLSDILEDIEMEGPGAIRGRRVEINKATILGRRLDENGHRKDYDKSIPVVQCLEVRATNRTKSNCLTTVEKDNVLTTMPIGRHPDAFGLQTGIRLPFRYYTRTEYERLQTLPDGYTSAISEQLAKKAIGNGWTVDVIVHIFSCLKKCEYNPTIGMWFDYGDTRTITRNELENELLSTTSYSLKDFYDRRVSTNLERFNYDPYTGEKIDWKRLRDETN